LESTIRLLSETERTNLFKKCLEIFFETVAKCYSITFPCANFDYFSSEFNHG